MLSLEDVILELEERIDNAEFHLDEENRIGRAGYLASVNRGYFNALTDLREWIEEHLG